MELMWSWFGEAFSLGAIHGITGILTVLLQLPSLPAAHLPALLQTLTSLCTITAQHSGHLPMSLPPRPLPPTRSSPLVQICHGAPGLLLALAAARRRGAWMSEWNEAARAASETVWREGLVSKGAGVCHGWAGNAWPWLLYYDAVARAGQGGGGSGGERDGGSRGDGVGAGGLDPDECLARALAFLMHAAEKVPLEGSWKGDVEAERYPWSLFEGLAGTVCAWADACVVIVERLEAMNREEGIGIERQGLAAAQKVPVLGVPGFGWESGLLGS
ncbi:hypothetical protein BDY21DRAFT_330064 [Lineolata rhizophorae]|uniref:Lanthionine synthetase C-like protein n=1 Tax=Lineolata rhizophorae TaxID=578093 RepID=A0A6A6PDQ0_9PEZI|nr:hypothetical protein BDY21DRAFT_330064 [Lineolata rhizophorae]